MVSIGKNVTTPGDPLQPVEIKKVYKSILNPGQEVKTLLNRLRQIRAIDPRQYRKLKTRLPYIVCADFRPKIRKKENFLKVSRFIIDIDHLSEFDLSADSLKDQLRKDPFVEMFYVSPSQDGIKVFFKLDQPISDSGYYSVFYKAFCIKFAAAYQLGPALDTKTSDVSRCCFVSHDPDAWYNPEARPVVVSEYLPETGFLELSATLKEVKEHEKEVQVKMKEMDIAKAEHQTLSDEALTRIKQMVGVRVRRPSKKEYFQPEELKTIEGVVETLLNEAGAQLLKSEPISYGRRLRIGADRSWAELNVFYGKKGVTVVKTTKTGSNKELASMLYLLLTDYFENYQPHGQTT